MMGAQQIGKQKGAYLCATLSRPPTNLPVSRAAALDQHKHRHLQEEEERGTRIEDDMENEEDEEDAEDEEEEQDKSAE